MNENGGVDWGAVAMLGHQVALQWYSTITQKPIATQEGVDVTLPGARVTAGTNTLVLVGVAVLALVFLLRK